MSDFEQYPKSAVNDPINLTYLGWKVVNNLELNSKEEGYLQTHEIGSLSFFNCNLTVKKNVEDEKCTYKCNKLHLALHSEYIDNLLLYDDVANDLNFDFGIPGAYKALEIVLHFIYSNDVPSNFLSMYHSDKLQNLINIYVVATYLQIRNLENNNLGVSLYNSLRDFTDIIKKRENPQNLVSMYLSIRQVVHVWPGLQLLLDNVVSTMGMHFYSGIRNVLLPLPREVFVEILANPYFVPRNKNTAPTATREIIVLYTLIEHYNITRQTFTQEDFDKIAVYQHPFRRLFDSIVQQMVLGTNVLPYNSSTRMERNIDYETCTVSIIPQLTYKHFNDQIYHAVPGRDDIWGIELFYYNMYIKDSKGRQIAVSSLKEIHLRYKEVQHTTIGANLIPPTYNQTILKGFICPFNFDNTVSYRPRLNRLYRKVKVQSYDVLSTNIQLQTHNAIRLGKKIDGIMGIVFTRDIRYKNVFGVLFKIGSAEFGVGPVTSEHLFYSADPNRIISNGNTCDILDKCSCYYQMYNFNTSNDAIRTEWYKCNISDNKKRF